VIALGIEEALKIVRVGLAEVGAVTGGEAVAEAGEQGAVVGCGGRGVVGLHRYCWCRCCSCCGDLGAAARGLAAGKSQARREDCRGKKSNTG
jgi:hypothetical protein